MSILTANNLAQSFGAYDVFSGISLSIPNDGKIGLVGPNGVGKTTLLLILAGLTRPSSGKVNLSHGTRIGYLSQESSDAFLGREHTVYDEMLTVFTELRQQAARLREMEAAMSNGQMEDELFERYSNLLERFELRGGYEYELHIQQVLTGLGFDESTWSLPLNHLSGGQKTRALLARLLLEEPDLLILDEPTNHLDVQAVEWLEGSLRLWPGAILLVSHDRYFLDRVVTAIWEMNSVGIETYRGNYSAYLTQRQERWERKQKEYDTLMERIDKEMDFIRRNIAGQRTQMAQGKLSRLAREVEALHAGGLQVLGALKSKGWLQVQNEYGLAARPAATVGELHERIGELRPPVRPPTLSLSLRASHRSGNIVLRTRDLTIGYPGNPLFVAEDIQLHRQECAALIGPNGTGKTTFLRTILGKMPPLKGEIRPGASLKIGYFAQAHDALQADSSVLDELLRHKPMMLSAARSYLARFLFRGDDVYNKVSTLSGGERGRLALAILVLEEANFLLLDEPTNHLDIPAQEALQVALETFGGTILLVSHDRYLIDRLATQIWSLDENRLTVFEGSYQAYLAARSGRNEALAEDLPASPAPPKETAAAETLSKNEQRRLEEHLQQLESRIHATEEKMAQLTEDLQTATQRQDVDEIRRISEAYAAAETKLAALMAEWEQAHERVPGA